MGVFVCGGDLDSSGIEFQFSSYHCASAREHGISYSVFMSGLKKSGIEIDRKTLSDMAINEPVGFQQLVEKAKSSIN